MSLQEPDQHLDYGQYGHQNLEYDDNTAEADYSEQQMSDPNQYSYGIPQQEQQQQQQQQHEEQQQDQQQYYTNQEHNQGASDRVVYIYPKSYGQHSPTKSNNRKRLATSTEHPQFGLKIKMQDSS